METGGGGGREEEEGGGRRGRRREGGGGGRREEKGEEEEEGARWNGESSVKQGKKNGKCSTGEELLSKWQDQFLTANVKILSLCTAQHFSNKLAY